MTVEASRAKIDIANWAALAPDDRVVVAGAHGPERAGIVETVSARGDAIWIRTLELGERKLIHAVDKVRLIAFPDELSPRALALLQQRR